MNVGINNKNTPNHIINNIIIPFIVTLRMMLPTYIGRSIEIQRIFQKLKMLITSHRQILFFPFYTPYLIL